MTTVETLKGFPVFAFLSRDVLARLVEAIKEEVYPPGAVIFPEGKWGDSVYFVAEGEVLIRKTLGKDQYKMIALFSQGEFFGEMALLEEAPRSAEAVAKGPVTLFRLPSRYFNALLEGDVKSALGIFRGLVTTLSGRLRQTTREMVAIFEVGRILAQELDIQRMSSRVLALLRHIFEDDVFGGFFYWNQFTGEYDLAALEGGWPKEMEHPRDKDDPLFGAMNVKRECLLLKDMASDSRFSQEVRAQWPGGRSFLAAPIFGFKWPVGYLVFGHPQRVGFFTSGHRQVLAGISNLLAPAIENLAWRQEMESKQRLNRSKMTRA